MLDEAVGRKALSLLTEKRHLFAHPVSDPMASRTVLTGRLLYLAYIGAEDLATEGPFDPRILRALVDGLTAAGILTRGDDGRVALAPADRDALDRAFEPPPPPPPSSTGGPLFAVVPSAEPGPRPDRYRGGHRTRSRLLRRPLRRSAAGRPRDEV